MHSLYTYGDPCMLTGVRSGALEPFQTGPPLVQMGRGAMAALRSIDGPSPNQLKPSSRWRCSQQHHLILYGGGSMDAVHSRGYVTLGPFHLHDTSTTSVLRPPRNTAENQIDDVGLTHSQPFGLKMNLGFQVLNLFRFDQFERDRTVWSFEVKLRGSVKRSSLHSKQRGSVKLSSLPPPHGLHPPSLNLQRLRCE